MANVLDKIIEDKKESLKNIKKNNSLNSLENTIKSLNNFLNFKDAFHKASKHLNSGKVFEYLTKLQSK